MFATVFINQIYINKIQNLLIRHFNYYGLPQEDLNTPSNTIDYHNFILKKISYSNFYRFTNLIPKNFLVYKGVFTYKYSLCSEL